MIKREFKGVEYQFYRTPNAEALVEEIFSDNYRVFASGLTFADGDTVLDIGACEGMFSIMLAKLYPKIRVVALEPIQRTYFAMMRNIGLNGVTNIEAHNVGIGKERGRIPMNMCQDDHSGGGSAVMTYNPALHTKVEVDVIGLNDVFAEFKIDRIKLLKIDIEGMEYEALYPASDALKRVDNIAGEFHSNLKLDVKGYRMQSLASWVQNRTTVIAIEACKMAE